MRRAALLALLLSLALGPAAGAVVLPADTTVVISGTPDLQSLFPTPVAVSSTTSEAVAQRGGDTLVVFSSDSDGLVADDDDSVSNVYVKDVTTGEIQLVSRQSDVGGTLGEPAHAPCSMGTISADGRAVAFVCNGALDPAHDQNARDDVYVRDLDTGQTTLVSGGTDGLAAGVASEPPAVAHDPNTGARYVAFQSSATNLVSPATPAGQPHVYRRTLGSSDAMERVDPGTNATASSISADGQQVGFLTGDRLDLTFDRNNVTDLYRFDFGTGTTTLMSRADGATGLAPAGGVKQGRIGPDGTVAAFTTSTSLDAARDHDGLADVYARSGNATELVSIGDNGERPGVDCSLGSVGRDAAGNAVVAFTTASTALDPAVTTSSNQAYVSSVVNGVRKLALVSRAAGAGPPSSVVLRASPTDGVALSPDGAQVAITLRGEVTGDLDPGSPVVVLRDLATGTVASVSRPPGGAPFVNAGGPVGEGAASADGRFVAFVSAVPALGLPAGETSAVYRRDLDTGAVTLVSRADGADGAPLNGRSGSGVAISAEGDRVAFAWSDPGQPAQEVYVRDIAAGRTFVASRADGPDAAGGPVGDGDSSEPAISADGTRVAFESTARNLVGGDDADNQQDVLVRELDSGRTLLVDRAAGAGAKADAAAGDPSISGDGRFVAFDTTAGNLVAGDTNGKADVYVRGLDDGSVRRASVDRGGAQGDGDSADPSLSRDGSRVAFDSTSASFDPAPVAPKLFLKDLGDGSLSLVGRADGANGAAVSVSSGPSSGGGAVLSADGRHVAFAAAPATSIAPGAPGDGMDRVYERDIASGVTRLISRRTGSDGVAVSSGLPYAITADGGCVTFQATGLATTPPASSDLSGTFLRAVVPNCVRPVPPGPGPGPGPVKPALLSRLSVKPARFFVVVRGVRGGGTRIAFRLDKASAVTLSFDRLLAGRLKGRRCLTTVHKGRRCTVVRRAGHLTVAHARADANTVKFSGKLGRKALAPGSYRLTATPLHGVARTVRFVVVKAPKPKPKHRR